MAAAGTTSRRDGTARRLPRAATICVVFAALAASGCTAGSVMDLRPSVDVGTTTSAVARVEPSVPVAPQPAPVASAAPIDDGMDGDRLYQAQLAAISGDAGGASAVDEPFTQQMTPKSPAEEEEQAVALLAPVPSAGTVRPAPAPQPAAAPPPQPELLGRVESRPKPILAAYPRVTMPKIAAPNVMPPEEVALRKQLKRLGVRYSDMPRIDAKGACGIDYPVKVMGLSGGIELKAPAVLNATMAVTFARYVKNDFAPAVRWRYMSGIRTIYTGSTYACRNMIGESTHKISEHAKGNAIDVMKIKLENGKLIDVTKPGFFAFRQRGFLNRVRAEACQYFTTVLGPGYNQAHANHFHFDLKHRRNGYVACR